MTHPLVAKHDPYDEHNSHDITEAVDNIAENYEAYESAREYDEINVWEYNRLSRAGRTLRQADVEFDPNFCGVVIDAVNNRMEIQSITASTGKAEDTETSAATVRINEIWDENELDNYVPSWHRRVLRDGDGYIVVWPTMDESSVAEEDDETIEDDLTGNPTGVNITYVDPRIGRMFYDSENPRKKRYFAQMWECNVPGHHKPQIRLNLFYPDRVEKYIAPQSSYGTKPKDFQPFYDQFDVTYDEMTGDPTEVPVWPIPNPYGEIPVFHLRTDLEYGKPEHRNAFALQDAISKLLEMMMVTVTFQGFPQRYALQEADNFRNNSLAEDPLLSGSAVTEGGDVFDAGVDLDSVSGSYTDNETGSNLEANPGGMMLLKGFKDVKEFSAADPNNFLQPWQECARAISTTTDTPLYKFQGLGGETPSGEALKIIEAPLNKKVRDRCRLFGGTWRQVFEFALKVLGIEARVHVTWVNPATIDSDSLDVWDLVALKISLGVPRAVAFMEAGVPEKLATEWAEAYDPAEHTEKLPSRNRDQARARR